MMLLMRNLKVIGRKYRLCCTGNLIAMTYLTVLYIRNLTVIWMFLAQLFKLNLIVRNYLTLAADEDHKCSGRNSAALDEELHCTEHEIYVFSEKELRELSPISYMRL
jgi:hypothetical protein